MTDQQGQMFGVTPRKSRPSELATVGVGIALDDFGTGYSSLEHVADLPLTTLKIDRAFVAGLGVDRARSAIVEASIAFGHALDLLVTGEGIETVEQRQRLAELQCDVGQGYLFGKAQPAALARPSLQPAGQPSLRVLPLDRSRGPAVGSVTA